MKLVYEVEPGEGHTRNDFIKEKGIKTYLIVRKKNDGEDSKISAAASQVCVSKSEKIIISRATKPRVQSLC